MSKAIREAEKRARERVLQREAERAKPFEELRMAAKVKPTPIEYTYYAIWSDASHAWGEPHRDYGYPIYLPDIKLRAISMDEAKRKVAGFNMRAKGKHLEDIYAQLKREGAIL